MHYFRTLIIPYWSETSLSIPNLFDGTDRFFCAKVELSFEDRISRNRKCVTLQGMWSSGYGKTSEKRTLLELYRYSVHYIMSKTHNYIEGVNRSEGFFT